MRLSELLNSNAVTQRLKARTKREALVELVEVLEAAHGFNSQGEILDRVMRREAMMTTGIGNGIAKLLNLRRVPWRRDFHRFREFMKLQQSIREELSGSIMKIGADLLQCPLTALRGGLVGNF